MSETITQLRPGDFNDPGNPAWEPVRSAVQALIDAKQAGARAIAAESGVSETALSQFLNRKYTGRNDRITDRLQLWLDTYHRRAAAEAEIRTGPGFVLTPTAERVLDALTYAQMAPDMVAIYGGAGLGKTEAAREYVRTNTGICLATMTPATSTVYLALAEVGKCLSVKPGRSKAHLMDSICEVLAERRGLLIIDEAQQLGPTALDQLRAIHDRAGVGIAFMGNEQVFSNMTGKGSRAEYMAPLFSRVGMRRHLRMPTDADTHALADAWQITEREPRKLLRQIAHKPGGLRGITKTLRYAHMLAAGQSIEARHIRSAWMQLTGEGMQP
jgi:DNA transposition AAA+ family ATPase